MRGKLDMWIEGYDTAQCPLVIAPYTGWQDNPTMDDKGISTLDFGNGVSQKADVFCQYMIVLALQTIYREEISISRVPYATIVH